MVKPASAKTTVFAALLLCGLLAWAFIGVPWGVYAANFVYLFGVTQGLLAIVVFLWLLGARWASSYLVPSGMITLAYAPIAVMAMLGLVQGQSDLFHWVRTPSHSFWFTSPVFFTRHLVAMILYYGFACYTLSSHLRDKTQRPGRLCCLLALFVLHQTLIGWDFGMNLSPGWHNTLFAPYFWFGNLYAGLAVLMLMIEGNRHRLLQTQTWENMRKLLLVFSIIWIYLGWSQFITIWYANIPEEVKPLYIRFSGPFVWPFGLMVCALFLVPFGALLLDRKGERSLKPILGIILFGIWLERYLMVIPPLRLLIEEAPGLQGFSVLEGVTTLTFFAAFQLMLSIFRGQIRRSMHASPQD
ncbi:MAG: hypothetical protein ACE5GK_00510 [Nitrospiria bacterium]